MSQQGTAKVKVEFLAAKNAKLPNVTIKQLYSTLLRSKEQTTDDLDEYTAALQNQASTQADKDNNKVPKVPKYYLKNMALVGNALVCQPTAPNFEYFPAQLKRSSSSTNFLESIISSAPSEFTNIQVNGKYIAAPRKDQILTDNKNVWNQSQQASDVTAFTETFKGIVCNTRSDKDAQYKTLHSQFNLETNQPFAVRLIILSDFSAEEEAKAKVDTSSGQPNGPSSSNNTSSSTQTSAVDPLKNQEGLIPSVDIYWGVDDCRLTVYRDRKITFTYKGKIIRNRVNFPFSKESKEDFEDTLVIYPLGNSVFVYSGVPTIESTTKRQYIEFNLGENVFIPSGPIDIVFNCRCAGFNYSPILHRKGTLFSPVIKGIPGFSADVLINTFHLGKFGVGHRGDNPPFPDTGDTNSLYNYLIDNVGEIPIQFKKASVGTNFAYHLFLNPKVELDEDKVTSLASSLGKDKKDLTNVDYVEAIQKNIYSPAIFSAHFTFVQAPTTPSTEAFEFDSDDVLNVTVSQSVERQTATVVLDNRSFDGSPDGKYPRGDIFAGIKPIQISMGFGNEAYHVVFTGYTTRYIWKRDGSTRSTMTMDCEDVSKKAKEQFCVNLPFMDGWCHLGSMRYLLNEAGYEDSEIDMPEVVGQLDTLQNGCFDGHVDAAPPDDYVHATLPLAVLGVSEPAYNFAMGTMLWQCMQRVREFINWYLYANHLGQIVYQPPKNILTAGVVATFKEVDTVGNFDEIHSSIEHVSDTAEMRNGVYYQGNTFVYSVEAGKDASHWATHVHIKNAYPNVQKPTDVFFAPYPRMAFMRDPKNEDVNLSRAAAIEIYRRLTRDRTALSLSAWGQLTLHPYDLFEIDESIMNETGANTKTYVVAAHTLTANGQDHTILSTINAEVLDVGSLNYDSQLPGNYRE